VSQRVVVTGVAGFIGSHTARLLLHRGWSVLGLDAFTSNYRRDLKEENLTALTPHPRFEFVEADVASKSLPGLLDGADAVLHLAGEPGVRPSWGDFFSVYVERNVIATQFLLEHAKEAGVARVVYASSSSVYGSAETFPTAETAVPRPISPYGVTKLAGEHLCSLYGAVHSLSTVSLRYFTVFGPRQRPDMAIQRIIECALEGRTFQIHGDGTAKRDFTFVDDVARANCMALTADLRPGTVLNIGGGDDGVELREVIRQVEELISQPISVAMTAGAHGDPPRTGALVEEARRLLGWEPRVTFPDGLQQHVAFSLQKAQAHLDP
jgi:UDP-glucuronate 4-epimerase